VTGFTAALWAEALKARRSRIPSLAAVGFSLAPLTGGLFMLILKDPAWARRFGLISAKAQIFAGTAGWQTYVAFLAQAMAVGGLVVFGLVVIWVFGREHTDRTITDLLALPTSRMAIVVAKFVVVASLSAVLTVLVYVLGLIVGTVIGLPGWSFGLAVSAAGQLAATGGLTVVLVTPFAWAASAGRGYLPPIEAMFLVLFLGQVIAALGWGAYFPWSVPALSSGVAGQEMRDLGLGSYLLVMFTGIAGVAGTLAWWWLADQP
jgi:ABC-2 type transport system permease protein